MHCMLWQLLQKLWLRWCRLVRLNCTTVRYDCWLLLYSGSDLFWFCPSTPSPPFAQTATNTTTGRAATRDWSVARTIATSIIRSVTKQASAQDPTAVNVSLAKMLWSGLAQFYPDGIFVGLHLFLWTQQRYKMLFFQNIDWKPMTICFFCFNSRPRVSCSQATASWSPATCKAARYHTIVLKILTTGFLEICAGSLFAMRKLLCCVCTFNF